MESFSINNFLFQNITNYHHMIKLLSLLFFIGFCSSSSEKKNCLKTIYNCVVTQEIQIQKNNTQQPKFLNWSSCEKQLGLVKKSIQSQLTTVKKVLDKIQNAIGQPETQLKSKYGKIKQSYKKLISEIKKMEKQFLHNQAKKYNVHLDQLENADNIQKATLQRFILDQKIKAINQFQQNNKNKLLQLKQTVNSLNQKIASPNLTKLQQFELVKKLKELNNDINVQSKNVNPTKQINKKILNQTQERHIKYLSDKSVKVQDYWKKQQFKIQKFMVTKLKKYNSLKSTIVKKLATFWKQLQSFQTEQKQSNSKIQTIVKKEYSDANQRLSNYHSDLCLIKSNTEPPMSLLDENWNCDKSGSIIQETC